MKKISCDIALGDTKLTLSTGILAPQTNASVVATWGGTVVLATVELGKLDESRIIFLFRLNMLTSFMPAA